MKTFFLTLIMALSFSADANEQTDVCQLESNRNQGIYFGEQIVFSNEPNVNHNSECSRGETLSAVYCNSSSSSPTSELCTKGRVLMCWYCNQESRDFPETLETFGATNLTAFQQECRRLEITPPAYRKIVLTEVEFADVKARILEALSRSSMLLNRYDRGFIANPRGSSPSRVTDDSDFIATPRGNSGEGIMPRSTDDSDSPRDSVQRATENFEWVQAVNDALISGSTTPRRTLDELGNSNTVNEYRNQIRDVESRWSSMTGRVLSANENQVEAIAGELRELSGRLSQIRNEIDATFEYRPQTTCEYE